MLRLKAALKSAVSKIFKTHKTLLLREDGAAAVEFALVVAPFLALLFAIMETAMVFFAGQVLETATADAGRLILTGQAQMQGLTQDSFKDKVCPKTGLMFGLFDCTNNMKVDVKTYASFSAADLSKPVDSSGNFTNDFAYQPGGPCAVVVVRMVYQFPVYVSLLGFSLADMAGGKHMVMATSVFRNEPYQGTCS
jgi:Flp pilus assembly protein TadG